MFTKGVLQLRLTSIKLELELDVLGFEPTTSWSSFIHAAAATVAQFVERPELRSLEKVQLY